MPFRQWESLQAPGVHSGTGRAFRHGEWLQELEGMGRGHWGTGGCSAMVTGALEAAVPKALCSLYGAVPRALDSLQTAVSQALGSLQAAVPLALRSRQATVPLALGSLECAVSLALGSLEGAVSLALGSLEAAVLWQYVHCMVQCQRN